MSLAIRDLADHRATARAGAILLKRTEALEAEEPANKQQHNGGNYHELDPRKSFELSPKPAESHKR